MPGVPCYLGSDSSLPDLFPLCPQVRILLDPVHHCSIILEAQSSFSHIHSCWTKAPKYVHPGSSETKMSKSFKISESAASHRPLQWTYLASGVRGAQVQLLVQLPQLPSQLPSEPQEPHSLLVQRGSPTVAAKSCVTCSPQQSEMR